jgi:hypothetical protein
MCRRQTCSRRHRSAELRHNLSIPSSPSRARCSPPCQGTLQMESKDTKRLSGNNHFPRRRQRANSRRARPAADARCSGGGQLIHIWGRAGRSQGRARRGAEKIPPSRRREDGTGRVRDGRRGLCNGMRQLDLMKVLRPCIDGPEWISILYGELRARRSGCSIRRENRRLAAVLHELSTTRPGQRATLDFGSARPETSPPRRPSGSGQVPQVKLCRRRFNDDDGAGSTRRADA